MRISDWSSDVCSSDLWASFISPRGRNCGKWFRAFLFLSMRSRALSDGSAGAADRGGCWLDVVDGQAATHDRTRRRSEEQTYELQSLMRISYDVFCLKKKKNTICDKKNRSTTTTSKQKELITNQ